MTQQTHSSTRRLGKPRKSSRAAKALQRAVRKSDNARRWASRLSVTLRPKPGLNARRRGAMSRIFTKVQTPRGQPRVRMVAVIAAITLIGVASLFLVQMPGALSSMLSTLITF